MRLLELVEVSNAVAQVSGRLEKTARLAEFFLRLRDREIDIGVAFLSGSPAQGRVGLGWAAISEARKADAASTASLELREVDEAFDQMAHMSGAGSARERIRLLGRLFARATSTEHDFLVRLLSGDLRQGALEGVLIEAIAKAVRSPAAAIRNATMMAGELGEVARVALLEGPSALSRYSIQLFRPVQPMLAESAETVREALELLGEAALEFKLDGARIQVHKSGEDVRVFSRALRDVTLAVPEVVEAARSLSARDLIIDGEVIALRPDQTPLPFQETMRRFGRRLEVARLRAELPLTPFFFDCLYVDGRSLIAETHTARVAALASVAPRFIVPRIVTASVDRAEKFLGEGVRLGHEGVMAKALDAPYMAGNRGRSWLKIKVVRTLDLVVLAAEWGSGRRRGWLSNLHLGARDPDRGGFVMLGKTFKGLTDEVLAWQTAALLERQTRQEGHVVYVRPELVVEIAFNDIQESPHYPGGLALRFARVKGYRPDKPASEADTLAAVQEIYAATTGKAPPKQL